MNSLKTEQLSLTYSKEKKKRYRGRFADQGVTVWIQR